MSPAGSPAHRIAGRLPRNRHRCCRIANGGAGGTSRSNTGGVTSPADAVTGTGGVPISGSGGTLADAGNELGTTDTPISCDGPNALRAKAVSAGFAPFTCGLTTQGGVRCWGSNPDGELGDGNTTNRSTPALSDVLTGVQAIATGYRHTCALMSNGGVRCWGYNFYGQLGDGTTIDRLSPPTSDLLSGVQAIAAGEGHTCALLAGGGVRCWGHNHVGQLGDGTTTDRLNPPSSDGLTGVQAIAAGAAHTCALMRSGGVRCWGTNRGGHLGMAQRRTDRVRRRAMPSWMSRRSRPDGFTPALSRRVEVSDVGGLTLRDNSVTVRRRIVPARPRATSSPVLRPSRQADHTPAR